VYLQKAGVPVGDGSYTPSGFSNGSTDYADTVQGITLSNHFYFTARSFLRVEFESSFEDIHQNSYSVILNSGWNSFAHPLTYFNGNWGNLKTAMRGCTWIPNRHGTSYPDLGPKQAWSRVTCISGANLATKEPASKVGIVFGHGHLPGIKSMTVVSECQTEK
jgi:hypothetical protein